MKFKFTFLLTILMGNNFGQASYTPLPLHTDQFDNTYINDILPAAQARQQVIKRAQEFYTVARKSSIGMIYYQSILQHQQREKKYNQIKQQLKKSTNTKDDVDHFNTLAKDIMNENAVAQIELAHHLEKALHPTILLPLILAEKNFRKAQAVYWRSKYQATSNKNDGALHKLKETFVQAKKPRVINEKEKQIVDSIPVHAYVKLSQVQK